MIASTRTYAVGRKRLRTHGNQPSRKGIPLQKELHQKTPFPSVQTEAFLNLLRTADQMQHRLHMQLKPYGITATQYNSLRILRGAGKTGLTCAEVGKRLISQDPDITRLMKRLERQGLVQRERGIKDRRIVVTKITSEGLQRLKELDPVVTGAVDVLMAHLSNDELKRLIDLLERIR